MENQNNFDKKRFDKKSKFNVIVGGPSQIQQQLNVFRATYFVWIENTIFNTRGEIMCIVRCYPRPKEQ